MDNTQTLKVDCRILLSLYLIVPVVFLAVISDQFFTSGTLLQASLPNSPAQWRLWTIIFILPHIVASWVTFADREYIQHYSRSFTLALPLICLATFVLHFVIGDPVAFTIFAGYTLYHLLSQQLGLTGMMLGNKPNRTFKLWRWSLILCGFPLFLVVGRFYSFGYGTIMGLPLDQWGIIIGGTIMLTSLPFAVLLTKQSKHRIGTLYLWANMAMVFTAFFCIVAEYYALAMIAMRGIHDITAFTVYMTHARNRNQGEPKNYFYKLFAFTRIPPMILCPLVALALAYPVTYYSCEDYLAQAYFVTLVLGYFHYYVEGFIWKKGSPHRKNLDFKIS